MRPQVDTLLTSAYEINFPNKSVDNVFCMRLLHHIGERNDRMKILKEFHRVSRDTVFISLWVDGNFKSRRRKNTGIKKTNSSANYQNLFVFSPQMVEKEFAEAGFKIVDKHDLGKYYPMWIYAPTFLAPGRIDDVASQIDVAPTLLSLLNVSYDSHFYGQDIIHQASYHPRAFMANYLTIGYMDYGMVAELGPRQHVRVVRSDSGEEVSPDDPKGASLIDEAISYYQDASSYVERCARKDAYPTFECSMGQTTMGHPESL